MKKYTKEELREILENHKHWICKDCEGWEGMRADLGDANLRGANLGGANLRDANLRGANLGDAYIRGAYIRGAKNVPFIPYSCPDTGSFVGYKKARDCKIVELEILSDAKRCSATGRKCRCDKAKVLSITDIENAKKYDEATSIYSNDFVYKVGEIVIVDNFEEDRWTECAAGIHFFINRQEAVDYIW